MLAKTELVGEIIFDMALQEVHQSEPATGWDLIQYERGRVWRQRLRLLLQLVQSGRVCGKIRLDFPNLRVHGDDWN